MHDDKQKTNQPSHPLSLQGLQSFTEDFPALFWRIERAKSRIEFLNDHPLPPFGDGARLLLKSREYRHEIVLPEDINLVESFFEAAREGRTMATVFRAHGPGGEIDWLKLTGATNSFDPRYYYGYLLVINDTVELILGILESDRTMRRRIGNMTLPVMLVDHKTRRIKEANAAAKKLFGLPRSLNDEHQDFGDLYPSSENRVMDRIMDEIVFQHSWSGRLGFRTLEGESMEADTTMRFLGWKKRPLVQVTVVPAPVDETAAPGILAGETDQSLGITEINNGLAAGIENACDIPSMLDQVMRHPLIADCCEAIMLSDIHVRKNKVYVYGSGAPLKGMPVPEEFSYRGTIAESIVRFGLDHLVVDDTMDSIKAIDWALFIPRGLRSYYAKPYFERKTLRTVLILCSNAPGRFENLGPSAFDAVLDPLNRASKACRKSLRGR